MRIKRRRTKEVTLYATVEHLQEAGVSVAGRVTFCATHDRAFLDDDADVCTAIDPQTLAGTEGAKWQKCIRGLRYALVLLRENDE